MIKKIIIAIIIILAVVGGYFLLNGLKKGGAMAKCSLTQEKKTHKVTYTNSGYSPQQLTIKVCDTVTWKNESSSPMWTASGIHPSHTIYSGTSLDEHCPDLQNVSFDECKLAQSGESWSFTFDKAGTWRYHNHSQNYDFGIVIVE